MNSDYLPDSEAELMAWMLNLNAKLPSHSGALDLLDSQMSTALALSTKVIDAIKNVQLAEASLKAAVKAKDSLHGNEIKSLREMIKNWKTLPGSSNANSADLGILSTITRIDINTYKAILTAAVIGGVIRLKFIKNGVDGVNIYKRKKGTADWIFLARDTASPYDDHIALAIAGQPEHYEYRSIGVIKDVEIGQYSDIVEVMFGG